MSITIETKLSDEKALKFIDAFGELFGRLERKLYVDSYVRKLPVNQLKSKYIADYGISARHFNSLKNQLDGKISAYQERRKELISEKESQIKKTQKTILTSEKKIKTLTSQIQGLNTFKTKVTAWRETGRKGKKPKLLKSLQEKDLASLREDKAKLKFKIHQKKRRLELLKQRLENLESKELPYCFGSRQLFRKQFHLAENDYTSHKEWLKDWRAKRSSQSFWIGSHDESFRNQNAQYDPAKKSLTLRVPNCLEKEFGPRVVLENIEFPYRQAELENALLLPQGEKLNKKRELVPNYIPVSYRAIKKESGESYLQAIFDPKAQEVSSSKSLGAVGIDLNADHIAFTETDRFGNPIHKGSYFFELKDKSSGQITAQLADHIAEIVDRAKRSGKILVCEDLDFSKKKEALRETATSYQRSMLSSFAYKKFFALLSGRARKEGVFVKQVNPAYTSVIGFAKFSGYKSYSLHELAALTIARRGLRLSERVKTKNALVETVCIPGTDDPLLFHREKRTRHVWSYWARNAEPIREVIRVVNSSDLKSSGKSEGLRYNPLRPTGYHQMEKRETLPKSRTPLVKAKVPFKPRE